MATIKIHPEARTTPEARNGVAPHPVIFVSDAYEIKDDLKARGYEFNKRYRHVRLRNVWSKAFDSLEEAADEVRDLGLPLDATDVRVPAGHEDWELDFRVQLSPDSMAGLPENAAEIFSGCRVLTNDGEITLD